MAMSTTLSSPLIVETEDKKLIFVLLVPLYLLSVNCPLRARPPGFTALEILVYKDHHYVFPFVHHLYFLHILFSLDFIL